VGIPGFSFLWFRDTYEGHLPGEREACRRRSHMDMGKSREIKVDAGFARIFFA
jgi:hypothetical protein